VTLEQDVSDRFNSINSIGEAAAQNAAAEQNCSCGHIQTDASSSLQNKPECG